MKALGYPLLLIWLLVPSSAQAGAAWWSLDETRTFLDTNGKKITTSVVTIDPQMSRLRVVSIPFEMKATIESTQVSLREFVNRLASDGRYRNKEWIVVNGGFSSYRVDVPLGLLVVDGKTYSTLSREEPKPPSSGAVESEFRRYRWSGVLCQRRDNRLWDILAAPSYKPGSCHQALQAGPVPVEPDARVGISPKEVTRGEPFTRTVICILPDSRIRIALALKVTHLFPMASWLAKPEGEGGLGCRVALNLSGDTSSGLAIRASGGASVRFFGDGSFPLPTALIAEEQ